MKPCYVELLEWAKEELETGSRVKASRIYKVALSVKERYERAQEVERTRAVRTSMYF